MQFKFSKNEIELIEKAAKNKKVDLSKLMIRKDLTGIEDNYILQSNDLELLNDIREACGDLLMIIGFTKDDEPTKEGRIIEGLMDKLFID